jgi:hypothetical protein
MCRARAAAALAAALAAGAALPQEPHEAHRAGSWAPLPPTAFSLAAERASSGTSWEPESSPLRGWTGRVRRLDAALRWSAAVALSDEPAPRGERDLFATGWVRGALGADLGAWHLSGRALLSPDRWTAGRRGWPLLLERGGGVVDRRHPQDLVLELAAIARLEVGPGLALEAYAAPVGEPALGPSAPAQRLSAALDPVPPLGHGALDAPHPSGGVVTFGALGRRVKVEVSGFRGREPDARRAEPDRPALDSGSVRGSVALGRSAVLQVSGGLLSGAREDGADLRRATLSAAWADRLGLRGAAAVTAAVGVDEGGGTTRRAALLEGTVAPGSRLALFGRAEWLERTAAELALAGLPAARRLGVGRLALGARVALVRRGPAVLAAGLRASLALVPAALEGSYGEGALAGGLLFLQLAPALGRGGGRSFAVDAPPG